MNSKAADWLTARRTFRWPFPLSLCAARGEGRGEGLRASALVAAPLIRPPATFSPRFAKGEGFYLGPSAVVASFHLRVV